MDQISQAKVIKAGFTIIRHSDYPSPRINVKDSTSHEWHTHSKYDTKAARDRAFEALLSSKKIICD